jgi:GntR family transcriptional repressor for pyruvate dehydrogenase complex
MIPDSSEALFFSLDYRSLTERTITQLRLAIKNNHFQPGQQLPSEAELGRQLKVSRTVMRQTLSHLKAEGLIISQQGKGHFVRKPSETAILLFSQSESDTHGIKHWFELLASLVMGAAGYAASARSVTDLAAIEAVVQSTESESVNPAREEGAFFPFYICLAAATHNPYFIDLLTFLHSKLSLAIDQEFLQTTAEETFPEGIVAKYQLIVDAIQASDGKAARDAVRVHLINTARRWGIHTNGI